VQQTLFHIPSEIAGLPVFGLGLLLAAWLAGSVAFMVWLVRKQGWRADTWSYVPLFALVAAIIGWLLPMLCDVRGLPIRGYGVMMLSAVVSGTLLAVWRGRRVGLNPDLIFTLAFWLFVPGLLGARLFYVVEYWSEQYWTVYQQQGARALLGAVLNVSQGGLVVYGAFVGGVIGLLLFVRKYRLPLLALCDVIAPSMLLGLALGRVGCLLNGCCFGGVCDHAWAVTFPPGSPPYLSQVARGQLSYGFELKEVEKDTPGKHRWEIRSVVPHSPAAAAGLQPGDQVQSIDGHEIARDASAPYEILHDSLYRPEPQPLRLQLENRGSITLPAPARSLAVHPTQIYSTIDALLLCLLLLAFDRFHRRDGELFALMITVYPITRFLVEMIRTDEAAIFGTGLTISQNVSLLILLLAAALWYYVLRRPPHKAFG
jgi:phosphatidylglycerol---prolipoprotein diacylglyceryl transferase